MTDHRNPLSSFGGPLPWSATSRLERRPLDVRQAMAQATAALRAGRGGEAEHLCRQVLGVEPEHAGALGLLGALALGAGRPDQALPLLQRAVRGDPASADAQAHLGTALLMLGREDDGVKALEAALKLKPSHGTANHNLGLRALNAGDPEAAARYLARALKKAPDNVEVLIAHGVAAAQRDKHAAAIADFRKALRLAPDHPQALANLGTALLDTEQFDEALKTFERLDAAAPGNPTIALHLGLAYRGLKNDQQAMAEYERALATASDYAPAHVNLAGLLWTDRRLESALRHYQAAYRLKPEDIPILENLSSLLMEMKRADEAIAVFRARRDHNPDDELLYASIIDALQVEGRFDEAEQEIEALLARSPQSPVALFYRARRGGAPEGDLDLGPLRRLADDPNLERSQRMNLLFALGKMCDDRSDFNNAFDFYDRANRLHNETAGHDPEQTDTNLGDIAAVFDRALMERMQALGSADRRPVFIVGMPRSGTTLTEQIIASHPDAAGAGELMTIPEIVGDLRAAQDDIAFPHTIHRLDEAMAAAASARYLKMLDEASTTAALVTDKLPGNYRMLGIIAVLFPNARVIHCRRDPRDTCLSIFFQQFVGSHTYAFDLYNLGRQYRAYLKLMEHWRRALPLPILEVDYEDTVADQETASRKLLAFLDLPWDDRVLRYYETKRTIQTASLWQARQPIYDKSVERWRHYEEHLAPLERGLAGLPREG